MKWLIRRRAKNQDLDEEIRFHLETEAQQRAADGQAIEDARAGARRDLGNVALVAEVTRDCQPVGMARPPGGLALLLASAGVYGLMAYGVSRRANEIGIRIALGARPRAVVWMVQRESLALTDWGVAAGLVASLGLGRLVSGMLYGLTVTHPAALAASCGLMLAVVALAGYVPARRAARVDPVVALRRVAQRAG